MIKYLYPIFNLLSLAGSIIFFFIFSYFDQQNKELYGLALAITQVSYLVTNIGVNLTGLRDSKNNTSKIFYPKKIIPIQIIGYSFISIILSPFYLTISDANLNIYFFSFLGTASNILFCSWFWTANQESLSQLIWIAISRLFSIIIALILLQIFKSVSVWIAVNAFLFSSSVILSSQIFFKKIPNNVQFKVKDHLIESRYIIFIQIFGAISSFTTGMISSVLLNFNTLFIVLFFERLKNIFQIPLGSIATSLFFAYQKNRTNNNLDFFRNILLFTALFSAVLTPILGIFLKQAFDLYFSFYLFFIIALHPVFFSINQYIIFLDFIDKKKDKNLLILVMLQALFHIVSLMLLTYFLGYYGSIISLVLTEIFLTFMLKIKK